MNRDFHHVFVILDNCYYMHVINDIAWAVDRMPIMYVAGGVDLWSCGQNVYHEYVAGGVVLWTCGLWTECLPCM